MHYRTEATIVRSGHTTRSAVLSGSRAARFNLTGRPASVHIVFDIRLRLLTCAALTRGHTNSRQKLPSPRPSPAAHMCDGSVTQPDSCTPPAPHPAPQINLPSRIRRNPTRSPPVSDGSCKHRFAYTICSWPNCAHAKLSQSTSLVSPQGRHTQATPFARRAGQRRPNKAKIAHAAPQRIPPTRTHPPCACPAWRPGHRDATRNSASSPRPPRWVGPAPQLAQRRPRPLGDPPQTRTTYPPPRPSAATPVPASTSDGTSHRVPNAPLSSAAISVHTPTARFSGQ